MASCSYKSIEFLATQIPIDMKEFYEEIPEIDKTMIAYMEDISTISALKTVTILHNLGFDICWIDPESDLTMTHALLRALADDPCSAALNNINLNVRNSKGETPLHLAVLEKNKTIVAGLLAIANTQKALNIDAMDNNGDTPLHKACKLKTGTIIEQLLNAGASTTVLNNNGETPLDIYPEVKAQLEAKKKAIDAVNVTSSNDAAEMKTETEENTCRLESDVAINTVPEQSCISETNPPVLMQFCNRARANSTLELDSSENNASNKRAKIE